MNRFKDMKTILLAAAASLGGSGATVNSSGGAKRNSSLLALEESSYTTSSTSPIIAPTRGAISLSIRAAAAPSPPNSRSDEPHGSCSSGGGPDWESRLQLSRRAMHALPHLLVSSPPGFLPRA
jgi:hypothetical protein